MTTSETEVAGIVVGLLVGVLSFVASMLVSRSKPIFRALLPRATYLVFLVFHSVFLFQWNHDANFKNPSKVPDHVPAFGYHPFLMGLAFCLTTEAVISFKLSPFEALTRQQSKLVHGALQFASFTLIFAALIVVFYNTAMTRKYVEGATYFHLSSVHSWFGFVAALLLAMSFFGGIFLNLVSGELKSTVRPIHRMLGTLAYVAFGAAMSLGIMEISYELSFVYVTPPTPYGRNVRYPASSVLLIWATIASTLYAVHGGPESGYTGIE